MNLPKNEPTLQYGPNSKERDQLKTALKELGATKIQIPCIINGKEIFTGKTVPVVMPHSNSEVLADLHLAGPKEIEMSIQGALAAKNEWANTGWEKRLQIFEKMADMLAGEWRMKINAATMLGQSKNAFQAEIDAACEFIDFFRLNAAFYRDILKRQPISAEGMQNTLDYRALDGFVAAITPFNFTAIAANIPGAPAMAGNVVVWKPSETQAFAAYHTMKLFEAAGLPPGVIQFVPAEAATFGDIVLKSRDLGSVHFTGSTKVFEHIYQTIGSNISNYKCFPRMIGETGGKDFIFAHTSADVDALKVALVRGAYEYQGQKCSAASRAYIPESVWRKLKDPLIAEIQALKMGDVREFSNFVNAVIDARSLKKIQGYMDLGKNGSEYTLLAGGETDGSKGFYAKPTLFQTTNPTARLMQEEIFGPVLTLFVFPDSDTDRVLDICANASEYALTGAIHAQDENVIGDWSLKLRDAAGNFYINDKPSGAVVGQQPFGGARRSGTNDKSGSEYNLIRWLSPRTIKRTLNPPKSVGYPFQQ